MFEEKIHDMRASLRSPWMKVAKTGRIGQLEERKDEWITLRFSEGRRLVFHIHELEPLPTDC